MTELPNPATIRAAFRTRAEAASARILAGVTVIFVGDLAYERDNLGTALTTQGGQNWSPFGRAYLAHWGAVGSPNIPGSAGQLSEPSGNDQTAIAAALLWCGLNGRELYGDTSRVYGVTGPLFVGGPAPQSRTWGLFDLNLYVKSWSATIIPRIGTGSDEWEQDAAVLTFGPTGGNPLRAFTARNIHIDCNRSAGTGVRYLHCGQSNFEDIRVDRQVTFGHDIGRPQSSVNSAISTTDCRYFGLRSREFWFSTDPTDGYTDWTVRTSCGLRVGGSDASLSECTISTAAVCVALSRGFNVGFDHCSFWGNPDSPSAPDYATRNVLEISRYACNFRFSNCRLEDGRVIWNGSKVPVTGGDLPAFQGQFIGNSFSQYTLSQLVLVAYEANETATNVIFVANRVRSNPAVTLAISGAGTWGNFSGEWGFNTNESGESWAVQGKTLVNGVFEVQSNGRIRLPAVSSTPVAATSGRAGELLFAADGNFYGYTGSAWRQFTGTTVV